MSADFKVTVFGDRADDFQVIFGSSTVAVKSPVPNMVKLENGEEKLAYMLDLDLLTTEQRERLVQHLMRKHLALEGEVQTSLDRDGLPILATDALIEIKHPERWTDRDLPEPFGLYDDFDGFDG